MGVDMRIFVALGVLLIASSPGLAEDPFEPTARERAAIDSCLKHNAKQDVLKKAAACVGTISDPCQDRDNATWLACEVRETKIWDDLLNAAFQDARRLADAVTGGALKDAQHSWIAFRDAKCAVSEKEYEGGSMAAVLVADCKRTETGRRAIEMRVIADEAADKVFKGTNSGDGR